MKRAVQARENQWSEASTHDARQRNGDRRSLGNWDGKQLVSRKWIEEATTPSAHGPDYGYLWWLNMKQKEWPSGPRSSFAAIGNGGNIIWIDPTTIFVLVWHWHEPGAAMDGMIQRIVASVRE